MAKLGEADLVIVPKFNGLSNAVDKALSEAQPAADKRGRQMGEGIAGGIGGGLVKSGAAIGLFSTITSKAMDAVSSHVGSAVARFDTMNAFPAVMESLGYSAEESQVSIERMSDRLANLPTTLDSLTGGVQRLVPTVKGVGKATDIMLAFNDAIVAGKGPVEIQKAAVEQFSQAVSRGKFELEEWRSVQTAMPGQLDQVAKAMLGAEAGTMDLYEALKSGDVSMGDFLDTLVRLDNEGGNGIMSFRQQAETAAGGVGTSMANMANAVTKGIAKLMDTLGEANIGGVFGDAKGAINKAFDVLDDGLSKAMPAIKGVYGAVKEIAPAAVAAGASFAVFGGVGSAVTGLAGRIRDAKAQTDALARANTVLGTSFTPASLAVSLSAAGMTALAAAVAHAVKESRDFEAATQGISDAAESTASLGTYSVGINDIGEKAGVAALSVSEMTDRVAENVEAMERINGEAESQIGQLGAAQAVIGQYAGQSDLTADAQGRLEWAISQVNEQFGLSITSSDVMADSYTDAEGEAHRLTDTINGLVEAKKKEIRLNALNEDLIYAYQSQTDAASALAGAKRKLSEYEGEYSESLEKGYISQTEYDLGMRTLQADVDKAQAAYDGAAEAVNGLEGALGDASKSAGEAADSMDAWGNTVSALFTETLKQSVGANGLSMLKEDMRALGASADDLANLSEEDTLRIAEAYDGTVSSVVDVLAELGIGMDEAARATAEKSDEMREAIEGFGDGFSERLGELGVDADAFAWKLAEAGVSTETLNEVGSENIAALADATGGSVDAMIWAIENYNATPLVDKDGNVDMDDSELIDAQGNVWAWNDGILYDKYGNAIVDDTELVDAQGNLWVWNGSTLATKDGSAHVEDGQLKDANGDVKRWHDYGTDLGTKTGRVNIFTSIVETVKSIAGHASGGIRPHADGGISVRGRSGGAIATQAVPLDIVGEEGAEAIVPLTNRRYSQPFADIIAEGVASRGVGRTDAVEERMGNVERLLGAILDAMPEVGSIRAGRDWELRHG